MTLLGFKTILHKKNVGPAKIQRVQQKIPGSWTYVQQNENKFQKVCMYTPTLALYSMFVLYRILVYSSLDRIHCIFYHV
jgi:hypothetical protein